MDCTIVMYHYVRDLEHSRYPEINAITEQEFRSQLTNLESEYSIISADTLRAAVDGEASLPGNALLLTFDDGLADHYQTVYPILEQYDLPGCFFPPSVPIRTDTVLDVHKLHLVLANCHETADLLHAVFDLLEQYQEEFELEPAEHYYNELAEEGRYDPEEIIFVKRLLQHRLSEVARSKMIDDLFNEYVSVSESTLSSEWYMTADQLRTMVDHGMYVGCHGHGHYWLNTLDRDAVEADIQSSLSLLSDIGAPTDQWIMSYPYGAYDKTTLDVIQEYDCSVGLTTEPEVADIEQDAPLELPRLDTNDFPT